MSPKLHTGVRLDSECELYETKINFICVDDEFMSAFMCHRCSGPGLSDCLEAARLAVSR